MADNVEQPTGAAESVDSAASAIEALLKGPGTGDPAEAEEVQGGNKDIPPIVQTRAEAQEAAEAETEEPVTQAESSEPETPKEPAQEVKTEAPRATEKPSDVDAAKDQTLAQLNVLIPQLQAAIQGEFADLKTFADLQKVASEDPARYNRYVIHQAQLQHAMGEQAKLAAEQHTSWYQRQVSELQKTFPDYIDTVKGPALRAELTAYAKKQGFDEGRMMRASASDVLTLNKAMQWDRYQAQKAAEPAKVAEAQAKAKEKAAKAPPVQKPGVAAVNDGQQKAQDSYSRLQRTGRVDDAARVLAQILG